MITEVRRGPENPEGEIVQLIGVGQADDAGLVGGPTDPPRVGGKEPRLLGGGLGADQESSPTATAELSPPLRVWHVDDQTSVEHPGGVQLHASGRPFDGAATR